MFRSLIAVVAAVITGLLACIRFQAPAAFSDSISQQAPYVVVIVLDGARPDYFNVPGIPHIQALIAHGAEYTNAWAGILESETPAGHAAIGSGANPTQNGILGFSWADDESKWVDLLDEKLVRSGAMEKVMKQAHAPSIAASVHAWDPTAQVVTAGGYKYYAQDAMGGPDANMILYYTVNKQGFVPTYIPGHAPPPGLLTQPGLAAKTINLPLGQQDHLAAQLAIDTVKQVKPRVLMINIPEFDRPLGHIYGANWDHKDVQKLMHGFDGDLARLESAYSQAGLLDQTIFVITADHGFAHITYPVLKTKIFPGVTRTGAKTINTVWHTAAYLWLRNHARAADVGNSIGRMGNPYVQSVYYKVNSKGTYSYRRAAGPNHMRVAAVGAANQYLLHSFSDQKAPDVVLFFTEEAAGIPHRSEVWKGDHGGGDWESQHIPLIMAGPGIKAGLVSDYPARLIDIAPTVLQLMGVPHDSMQGMPLADAMTAPSAADVAQQNQEGQVLTPLVNALINESRLELAAKR